MHCSVGSVVWFLPIAGSGKVMQKCRALDQQPNLRTHVKFFGDEGAMNHNTIYVSNAMEASYVFMGIVVEIST